MNDPRAGMTVVEINDTNTIRQLNLTDLALRAALKIIDKDYSESDMEALTLLRKELKL